MKLEIPTKSWERKAMAGEIIEKGALIEIDDNGIAYNFSKSKHENENQFLIATEGFDFDEPNWNLDYPYYEGDTVYFYKFKVGDVLLMWIEGANPIPLMPCEINQERRGYLIKDEEKTKEVFSKGYCSTKNTFGVIAEGDYNYLKNSNLLFHRLPVKIVGE